MSKFFKSLLLLLSAGLFTATGWAVTLIDPNPTASFTDFSSIPTGTTTEATTLTVNGIEWVLPVGVTKNEDGTINLNAVGSEIRFPAAQNHISIVLDLAAAPTVSGAILDYGKISLYYTANSELKALWEGGEWGTATAWTWSETNTKVMLAMAKANNDGTTYAADGITALTQASLRATTDTYTNAYIGCCDGNAKYANLKIKGVYVYSNSKLTEMPTFTEVSAYERTIEGTEDWAATDAWATGVANPEAGTLATLNVTGDAELTMNEASNALNYLEINGSGSLTITGSNPLTATSTLVNVSTTVNTSASLGKVTIANGKTLTVKNGYFTNSDNISNGSKLAGAGTVALDLGAENGLTLYGNGAGTFSGAVDVLSGTLTITGAGGSGFLTGRTVNVLDGAAVTIGGDNATGHGNTPANSILHVQNGGTVNFSARNSFKSTLKLTGGTVNLTGGDNAVDGIKRTLDWMSGGDYLQAAALEDATAETPTVSTISQTNDCGLALRSALGIVVEEKAKLVIGAPIVDVAAGAVTKKGLGVLELAGQNTSSHNLTVEAGQMILSGAWAGALSVNAEAKFTYTTSATPTKTLTNNGTIAADGEGTVADLTGATLSGSGTYAVTNGATLILPAGTENGASVTNGTLKLLLSPEYLATGYEANVADGTVVTFVKAGAEDYETVAEGVTQYELPAMDGETFSVTVGTEDGQAMAWSSVADLNYVYKNATLSIHFTADNQIFTFDNTLGVSLTSLTVTAEDSVTGGTIAFPTTEGLVFATTTTINTNVTATGKSALGAVTVAGEKSLTITDDVTFDNVQGSGKLVKTGTVDLTLSIPDNTPNVLSKYDIQSGKLTISAEDFLRNNWADGKPSFTVAGNAHLVWDSHDIIGWGRANTVTVAEISGILEKTRDANETFSGRLLLKDGGELRLSASDDKFMLHNSAIIAVDANAMAMITGNRLKMNDGTPEINVGENATLNGEAPINLAVATKKTGAGTWNQTAKISGASELKIEEGTLVLTIGDAFEPSSSATVTVNGTLESAGTGTTFYRTVLGTGKIFVPTGKFLAIGESDRDVTETRSGLSNFAGTLEVAGTFDARSWASREYVIGACDVKVLDGGRIEKWSTSSTAKLNIASGKTLSGAGTITIPVTFADGATLDTTEGTLTVSGAVTLPSDLTVKIAEGKDVVGTEVTLLNAADVTIPDGMAVTVMAGETAGKKLYTVTREDGAVKLIIAERPVTDTVTATVPASGTYTLADALGDYALTANATLTIDFGETSGQAFTFDNTDDVSFAQIIVTGTNGGTLAKTGSATVSATATAINTDTTVEAGVASLGTVTIADDKTLTVKDVNTVEAFATESQGALAIDATAGDIAFTAGTALTLDEIRQYSGKIKILGAEENGTTLAFPYASGALQSQIEYVSGTHALNYGRSSGNGDQLFATGKGDASPTILVKNGATVNFAMKDLSGWNGAVSDTPAVIRVENGGTLNFKSSGGSGFFRDRLVLDGGAVVENVDNNFILYGGASEEATKAQIAMLDSDTPVEAEFKGTVYLRNANGGQAGTKGASIAVGNNATLTMKKLAEGTTEDTLRKLGGGTLKIQGLENVNVKFNVATGTLHFVTSYTSTSELSGAGVVMADGNGVELNFGSANCAAYTGTPIVQNGATLILPAGAENGMTVPADCTLKLVLSDAQQAAGYTMDLAEGSTATFVGADFTTLPDDEDGDPNTFTPALNTWTAINGTAWETEENWSNGLPEDGDSVAVEITDNTTLTLPGNLTVGTLVVKGSGILTLESGKITATAVVAKTDISASNETLTLAPMQIAEGVTVRYAQSGTENDETTLPELTGEGTFAKTGTGRLTFNAEKVCEPKIEWGEGILRFGAARYNNVYNVTAKDGSTILMGGGWTGELTSSSSTLKLEGGSTLWLYNGNVTHGSTVAAQIVIDATAEKPAVIAGSQSGDNTNITGTISGKGVVEIQDKNDNYFTISGVIANGDAEGDVLAVKVVTDRGVTFTGENTYTGGTEIVAGAKLTVTNVGALGTGAITGAGTLICDGVLPTNTTGLTTGTPAEGETPASGWTGTVQLEGDISDEDLDVATLANAASSLTITGALEACAFDGSIGTLTLNGSFRGINGSPSTRRRLEVAELTGSGTIYGHKTPENEAVLVDLCFASADTFTGTVDLSGDTSSGTTVCFGQSATSPGNIVFTTGADAVVPEGKTWTAVNGVYVHGSGAISGSGTIALPESATFRYESSEASTFDGDITGVTVDETTSYGNFEMHLTSEAAKLTLNGQVEVASATVSRNIGSGQNGMTLGGTMTVHEAFTAISSNLYLEGKGGSIVMKRDAVYTQGSISGMSIGVELEAGAVIAVTGLDTTAAVTFPESGAIVVKLDELPATFIECALSPMLRQDLEELFTFKDANGNDKVLAENEFVKASDMYEDRRRFGVVTTPDTATTPASVISDVAQKCYDMGYESVTTIEKIEVAECFEGFGLDYNTSDQWDEGTFTLTYGFGVSDITVAKKTVNETTSDWIAIAVKVTNGGMGWGEEIALSAALRSGTKIHLSKDGGDSYDEENALTQLSEDELVGAGLATAETKADVYAGKSGVYWYWAEALPEIDPQATSKTVEYKVKAVNNGE